MGDLQVSAVTGSKFDRQIEMPLAGLAPGDYVVEIKAAGEGGEAKELVAFRVTG